MAELRTRTRSATATAETQLGMLTHDDLMRLRRNSMEINEMVVGYTNQVVEHLNRDDDTKPTTPAMSLSILDPHPELRALEERILSAILGPAGQAADGNTMGYHGQGRAG